MILTSRGVTLNRLSFALASCCFLLFPAVSPSCGAEELVNGTFRLRTGHGRVTSLEIDAGGKGHYESSWLVEAGFEGFVGTEKTRVVRTAGGLQIKHLTAVANTTMEVRNGGLPVKVAPGHTLGQSFTVAKGSFRRLEVLIPTWGTSTSSVVLSLRKGGPQGTVVAHRRLTDVTDNSWQALTVPEQGPGNYVVQLSEVVGTAGWWSSRKRRYKEGQAFTDGTAVPGQERALRVFLTRRLGGAEMDLALEDNKLTIIGTLRPDKGERRVPPPLLMTYRWDNTGYDVSSTAVPFSRFFTPTMRYLAAQQLKRWVERDGWYELGLGPVPWIEADGTGKHDLRFHGDGLHLRWHLQGMKTTLQFKVSPRGQGESVTSRVVVEALRRDDTLPPEWPRFVLPDANDTADANTFFYERAFSYPPVWGPAPWHEWNALCRVWQGGAHLDLLRRNYEAYPMTTGGYVHTWGARAGWPFPDNKKYDTRHFDTNARFILGCWRYAAWTGDKGFLRRQAERLRRAMNYQLTTLHGMDGLIVAASKDVTGRHKGVGDNYWDILPFGHLDAYANIVWYASLEAMAQLEEMFAQTDVGVTQAPARTPDFYRNLAVKVRKAFNDRFWNDSRGRYIGCLDVEDKPHDYGFTFVNVEAVAYGLADAEQVQRIYHWMETEPTSSGKPDTYTKWVFAPRANTLHNPRWAPGKGKLDPVPQDPWWHFGWHGTAYGEQCQDGGAILYTSFFDLCARARYLGPDDAWIRWQAILGRWRLPDHLCGGPPLFRGEHPQLIRPGAVGVDIPFPESGLVPCYLLYGVLGAQATSRGLEIAPRLPKSVPWVEIQNVAYHGLPLTIHADRREVAIRCEQPGYQFQWRRKLGPQGKAVFVQPPAPVRFPVRPRWAHPSPWHGTWIWCKASETKTAYFRYSFVLPATPQSAWLTITADNSFELYINGTRIAQGNDWGTLYRADATRLLRHGRNVVAVVVHNADGPGGLLADGKITLPDGQHQRLFTSGKWRVHTTAQDGWREADFDDETWSAARELGRPPCPPWGDMAPPDPQR